MVRMAKPNREISGGSKTEASAISNLGGGNSAIPSDTETQEAKVNKAHQNHDNGREAQAPQALSLLGYLVLCRAVGRILKHQNSPIAHEQSVSEIGKASKMEEFLIEIGGNAPKSEKGNRR